MGGADCGRCHRAGQRDAGVFLKIITFPLTVLTLGVFWFVINAIMLELASTFVRGFHIRSFGAAFVGGIVLTLVNMLLKWLVMPTRQGSYGIAKAMP
jgi:uncharacterized membrane protein YvlD (DUF360 family)